MSRTTAIPCETRPVLRCVYADLDAVVLGRGGSFLHDADGGFTLLGARALEACERAQAEVVVWSERAAGEVVADAARLGLRAWIGDGVLALDGEPEPVADAPPRSSATSAPARAPRPTRSRSGTRSSSRASSRRCGCRPRWPNATRCCGSSSATA